MDIGVLIVALAIDLTIGEWPNKFHPVVWIGNSISACKKWMLMGSPTAQIRKGQVIAIGLPTCWVMIVMAIDELLGSVSLVQWIFSVWVLTSMFALSALGKAAMVVHRHLSANQLNEARSAMRALCSRDSSSLTPSEMVNGTVASIAENISDSFIAPLFFYMIFGLPGVVFYRVINTLDAMVGYRGEWEYAGKASAKLDDILNYIPARITAILLLLVGFLYKKDCASAWNIYQRDRHNTPSPNGGHPMSVMAGLLEMQIVKKGVYTLGGCFSREGSIGIEKINQAWVLALMCGFSMIALCVGWVVSFQ